MLRFSPRPNRAHLVHWREWGEAAFEEAQRFDRPVLLCITAFWCGFCQRMDETSFSSDEVIALLNAFFLPLRVEESQRPDVDIRYNPLGGYPAIVFLTPRGEPLLSVQHMPPDDFAGLLARVTDLYQNDRHKLMAMAAGNPDPGGEEDSGPQRLSAAQAVEEVAGMLEGLADREHGGFGLETKHLHAEALDFELYLYERHGDQAALDHARLSLRRLRASPTWDARDGGFYRYSSRRDWREPHPEKLLDDQASLLRVYLHAYLLTGESDLSRTAQELLAYLTGSLSLAGSPAFAGCQDYVFPAREQRGTGPLGRLSVLDELAYCDANARAASALLDAWLVLGRSDCRERALRLVDWLWHSLRTPDGRVWHYWLDGAQTSGLLVDAARLGLACLDAWAAGGGDAYLQRARQLAEGVAQRHLGPAGALLDQAEPGPGLTSRPIAVLSQNAVAASFLTRLAVLSEEPAWRDLAGRALTAFLGRHREYGAYAAGYGRALADLLYGGASAQLRSEPGSAELHGELRQALAAGRYAVLMT